MFDPPFFPILALDCSTERAVVAILTARDTSAGTILEARARHAAGLAPAVRDLLVASGVPPRSLAGIAVGLGPGSFTGLRVGLALAKGLAYALGCRLAGFDSLALLAAGAVPDKCRVRVVVEAQRDAVYAADYARDHPGGPLHVVAHGRIEPTEGWLASLAPGDHVIGPPVDRRRAEWLWPADVSLAEPEQALPSLTALDHVARAAWLSGEWLDAWSVEPIYLRRSAAEEKAGQP